MPITFDGPSPSARVPGPFERLGQHAERVTTMGDPLAATPEPETPGWGDTWKAMAGTTWLQGAANLFTRPTENVPEFNAFRFIRERPDLNNDPRVLALVERGQFDGSGSEDQFWSDYNAGVSFFDDLETLERATTGRRLAAMGGVMIGDPLNLVPLAGAFKLAGQGRTLARTMKIGGLAGGISLGNEALTNTLNPATNEPGVSNELLAFGSGAALGGTLGLLTSPAFLSHLPGASLPSKKLGAIRRELAAAFADPQAVRSFDPAVVKTDADLARVGLADEIGNGRRALERALAEEPTDNRVVSALRRAGDDNDGLIGQLQTKYAAAGKRLHVIEHPDQSWLDLLEDVRGIVEHPDLNAAATSAELSGSLVDRGVSAVATRYANLQARVTPGGRLAQTLLADVGDVLRTLSASERTISKGSARDPFNFPTGASAEGLASVYVARKDDAIRAMREAFRSVRKAGESAISYDGRAIGTRMGYSDFRRAVVDYTRRLHARASGFDVAIPTDVHPSIKQAADDLADYFGRMLDEGEGVGMFQQGPRALAAAKSRTARTDQLLTRARSRLAEFQSANDVGGVAAMTERVRKLEAALAKERAALADLEWSLARGKHYLPRVYRLDRVLGDEAGFKDKLAAGFKRADSIVGGERVPDDARPLIAEVAEMLDRQQLAELAAAVRGRADSAALGDDVPPASVDGGPLSVVGIVEGDLSPEMRMAYRGHLDAFYRRAAQKAFDTLTEPKERHGVVDVLAPENPVRRRVMTIDESDLGDFLESDPEEILNRYARVMSGRIASRRSIQLNPSMWEGRTLKDGTPIATGQHLMAFLDERLKALQGFTAARVKAGADPKLNHAVQSLRAKVARDIGMPLDLLEGRSPVASDRGAYSAFRFFGRSLIRLSYVNKLGSALWAQLNDLAPVSLFAMQRPRTLGLIARTVAGLKSMPERDLRVVGLMFEQSARARALADVDAMDYAHGFGQGATRRVSAAVDRGLDQLSDVHSRVSLMNWITEQNKRVSGALVIDRVNTMARRMVHARGLMAGGMDQAAAMKAAKLTPFDAAWANKLGLNEERAERWVRLLHEHGLTMDDRAVSSMASLDDFRIGAKGQRQHGPAFREAVLKANFAEWALDVSTADGAANRQLLDLVAANINAEVNRSIVVTPGVFDRPNINNAILGRMFNQFQAFNLAFTNQRLRVMAQMPTEHQLWYGMAYLFMGALTDAISSHLAGRRTLEETAAEWRSNPLGMTYGAWERSGLAGWLARPIAIADAAGVPWSPGNLAGNTSSSVAARHIAPGRALTMAGPAFSDIDRGARVLADLASGRASDQTAYEAAKLAPFQNLVWLRALYAGTGAPVVPEAIIADKLREKREAAAAGRR